MPNHKTMLFAAGFAVLFAAAGFAQNQNEPTTVRDYCIKVPQNKAAAWEAFGDSVMVPLVQAEADAGDFESGMLVRAVVPAGEKAPCDYRAVYIYHGLFPAPLSKEQTEAAIKRAHLNITAQQISAKWDSLARLVNVDYWIVMDRVGTNTQKGNFVRLNHYEVKPNDEAEWARLQTTYWKPLVASWIKAGNKGSWALARLEIPLGSAQPYNGLTVDTFPDWNSLEHDPPVNRLWPKLHPNTDMTLFFERLDGPASVSGSVSSRYDTEIYKVIDLGAAKSK